MRERRLLSGENVTFVCCQQTVTRSLLCDSKGAKAGEKTSAKTKGCCMWRSGYTLTLLSRFLWSNGITRERSVSCCDVTLLFPRTHWGMTSSTECEVTKRVCVLSITYCLLFIYLSCRVKDIKHDALAVDIDAMVIRFFWREKARHGGELTDFISQRCLGLHVIYFSFS